VGIDIVNDGEFSKSSWASYFRRRLTNVEARPGQRSTPGLIWEREEERFPDWFEGARAGGGPLFSYVLRARTAMKNIPMPLITGSFCTGPLNYIGQQEVQRDIANLKAAARGVHVEELSMTALAPTVMTYFLKNEHYASDRDFLFAIADAMNEEYRTHQPHTDDIPLEHILNILLKVNVGAYSFEASSPRHDHEWQVWKKIKLPDRKILIPGVIGHFTDWIEHPKLVAERILKYASVVGRENVIAGVDCGLGTRVGTESILWAKFESLVEGGRIASRELSGANSRSPSG